MKSSFVIATRESPLALWQAHWVKQQVEKYYPQLTVTLLKITTIADKMLATTLDKVGGKGLFVKELEIALLDGRADIAVHSMKDVPMNLPDNLCLTAICEREDPRDVFISKHYQTLSDLPKDALIGTSSSRRHSQLRAYRTDLLIENCRGNVNTRLQRLERGEFTALILAAAGIKRLGLSDKIRSFLDIQTFLPPAGQGALGIECRKNDIETQQMMQCLNHASTYTCVSAERTMCLKLGGGCQVPIGAYAERIDHMLCLRGFVGQPDGSLTLRAEYRGSLNEPEKIGSTVADMLLAEGADRILHSL